MTYLSGGYSLMLHDQRLSLSFSRGITKLWWAKTSLKPPGPPGSTSATPANTGAQKHAAGSPERSSGTDRWNPQRGAKDRKVPRLKIVYIDDHRCLFGGIPTPLKNIKSVGMIIPNIWKNKKCSKPPTINQSSDTPTVNGNYFAGTCLKHELVLLSLFARNRNPSMAEKRYSIRDTTSDILQCIYIYICIYLHTYMVLLFNVILRHCFPEQFSIRCSFRRLAFLCLTYVTNPKITSDQSGRFPRKKKSCTVKFCRSLPCFFSQSIYNQSSRFFELQTWSNNGLDLP